MVFRGSDARRRRLVVDPAAQTGDVAISPRATSAREKSLPPSSPPKRSKNQCADARAYSSGAERRNQLKTTDLIPKRVLSYLLVVFCLIFSLAAINFLSCQSSGWQAQIGDAGLTAFAISGKGSIANWFVSFLLIMTGLSCLQIYAIRQHRCDDYRGTYRLWVWMAGLFVIASINCVVDLGTVAFNVTNGLTNQSLADRAWLMMALKQAALTVVVARVMYEVRQSRGSIALSVFVWAAFTLSLVLQLPVAIPEWIVPSPEMVAGNCVLFGTAALLLAHLTYGRFIFLQANGLIQQKSRIKSVAVKKKDAAAKKPKTAPGKTSKSRTTTKKKTSQRKPAADSDESTKPKTATKSVSQPKSKRRPKTETTDNSRDQKKANQAKKSPSDVLKELAAASRAKEMAKTHQDEMAEDEAAESVIMMSKAQRRKQRKLEKQRRRAA